MHYDSRVLLFIISESLATHMVTRLFPLKSGGMDHFGVTCLKHNYLSFLWHHHQHPIYTGHQKRLKLDNIIKNNDNPSLIIAGPRLRVHMHGKSNFITHRLSPAKGHTEPIYMDRLPKINNMFHNVSVLFS